MGEGLGATDEENSTGSVSWTLVYIIAAVLFVLCVVVIVLVVKHNAVKVGPCAVCDSV